MFSFLLKRGFRPCLAGSRRRCFFLLNVGIEPSRRCLSVGLHRERQTYRARKIKRLFYPQILQTGLGIIGETLIKNWPPGSRWR